MKRFFVILIVVAGLVTIAGNCKKDVNVTGVTLDQTSVELAPGATMKLTPTILPEDATLKTVTWTSSNPEVATVTNGTVEALKEGTATITVTTQDQGKTATCTVEVKASVISEDVMRMSLKFTNGVFDRTFDITGSGEIVIYWGDGKSEKIILANQLKRCEHTYSDTITDCTIIVTGKNITNLTCSNQEVYELDVHIYPMLKELLCANNNLTELSVVANTNLTRLDCYNNYLTTLDLSKNTALDRLDCYGNELTTLNTIKNTLLTRIDCNKNKLTALELSKNTLLKELSVVENELTELDVTANVALFFLNLEQNKLTDGNLNALFNTLHSNTISGKSLSISGNPGAGTCNRTLATDKGWVFGSKKK